MLLGKILLFSSLPSISFCWSIACGYSTVGSLGFTSPSFLVKSILWFVKLLSVFIILFFNNQHKDFEEIEGRFQRREPLILGRTASRKQNRRPPGEVISDPLSDTEDHEGRIDPQKPHQVHWCFSPNSRLCMEIDTPRRFLKVVHLQWVCECGLPYGLSSYLYPLELNGMYSLFLKRSRWSEIIEECPVLPSFRKTASCESEQFILLMPLHSQYFIVSYCSLNSRILTTAKMP